MKKHYFWKKYDKLKDVLIVELLIQQWEKLEFLMKVLM